MGSAYTRMSGSLQQSLAMMEQMNDCMEHYVQAGLIVSASVTPAPYDRYSIYKNPSAMKSTELALPIARISVRNSIKFPVSKIVLSVSLTTPEDSCPLSLILQASDVPAPAPAKRRRIECHVPCGDDPNGPAAESSVGTGTELPWRRRTIEQVPSTGDGDTDGSGREEGDVFEVGPFDLEPGKKVSWTVQLAPPDVARYRLALRAAFPSPGSGATLTTSTTVPVRILDQCRTFWQDAVTFCDWQPPGTFLDEREARSKGCAPVEHSFSLAQLRLAFAIHGWRGINEGDRGHIQTPDGAAVASTRLLCLHDANPDQAHVQFDPLGSFGGLEGAALIDALVHEIRQAEP